MGGSLLPSPQKSLRTTTEGREESAVREEKEEGVVLSPYAAAAFAATQPHWETNMYYVCQSTKLSSKKLHFICCATMMGYTVLKRSR